MTTNWLDTMIIQYEEGRKDLRNRSISDINDQEKVNSMITSMSYCIDWLKVGRDPEVIRGIDISNAYQKQSHANMDIFPMSLQPSERELSDEEKQSILNILMSLTRRERECFMLNKAYMRSYREISEELGIGRSTVQKYVERAKNKISCRADVVQVS